MLMSWRRKGRREVEEESVPLRLLDSEGSWRGRKIPTCCEREKTAVMRVWEAMTARVG